jgi:hypothetical protein
MSRKIDLVGQKFGRLMVIEPSSPRGKRSTWKCLCDCGAEKIAVGHELKSGDTRSCGCIKIELSPQKVKLMNIARTKYTPVIALARNIWRARYDELPFEDFYELSAKNCFYCDAKPTNTSQDIFIYNGLDRVDSSLEHTINNVIPCCWICNRAKNNRSIEKFAGHISNLVSNKDNRIPIKDYIANSLIINTELYSNEKYPLKTTVNSKFSGYYNDTNLTIEQFYQLSQLNCYYCGQVPSNIAHSAKKNSSEFYKLYDTFVYNGLDRIDSNFPHNHDNIVPSCKYCNYAKQSLSLIEFYQWIERLAQNKKSRDFNLDSLNYSVI